MRNFVTTFISNTLARVSLEAGVVVAFIHKKIMDVYTYQAAKLLVFLSLCFVVTFVTSKTLNTRKTNTVKRYDDVTKPEKPP